jgi:hypothetical protein
MDICCKKGLIMKPEYLLLSAICLLAAFPSHAVQFLYVSPEGDDNFSGSSLSVNEDTGEGPLASLTGARNCIRTWRKEKGMPAGGFRVVLSPGLYLLAETFQLEEQDSGLPGCPIVYEASPDAEVRISGGAIISNFGPVTDGTVLETLDPSARTHVLVADLKALGISSFGTPEGGAALYFRNAPMSLARWPNDGFTSIVDIVVEDDHKIHGIPGSMTGLFTYEGDRPSRWLHEKDGWLHGYWFWDWSDERKAIARIDPDLKQLAVAEPAHTYGYRKGQWYYAYNLLSEIDQPGEWYLDRTDGLLYFWPPQSPAENDAFFSILPKLLSLHGCSHITFKGLTFEHARDRAVEVKEGAGIQIRACTVRNCGGDGLDLSGPRGHLVSDCHIYQMGGKGISLTGGDRKSLTPAGHRAENNLITDYSQWYRMYRAGINLVGVGNSARHNHIHNAPHMAIFFSGNDHLLEYNLIHHVCLESNDAGAIYAGRNWTMRGNMIRFNFLHDILGFQEKECVGVYLDDMFSSAQITDNLFVRVTRAAFIGGGRDCSVVNNIFIDCRPALHVDARALGWAAYHADEWLDEAAAEGTLSGIRYGEAPYSERYPALPPILEENPKAPCGNLIARNICIGGKWDEVEDKARELLLFEDNLIDEDPGFVDRDKGDYRLQPDSRAGRMGIRSLPLEAMGNYEDSERAF